MKTKALATETIEERQKRLEAKRAKMAAEAFLGLRNLTKLGDLRLRADMFLICYVL